MERGADQWRAHRYWPAHTAPLCTAPGPLGTGRQIGPDRRARAVVGGLRDRRPAEKWPHTGHAARSAPIVLQIGRQEPAALIWRPRGSMIMIYGRDAPTQHIARGAFGGARAAGRGGGEAKKRKTKVIRPADKRKVSLSRQ